VRAVRGGDPVAHHGHQRAGTDAEAHRVLVAGVPLAPVGHPGHHPEVQLPVVVAGGAALPAGVAEALRVEAGTAAVGAGHRRFGRGQPVAVRARTGRRRDRDGRLGQLVTAGLAEPVPVDGRRATGRAFEWRHQTTVRGRTALAWSTSAYLASWSG